MCLGAWFPSPALLRYTQSQDSLHFFKLIFPSSIPFMLNIFFQTLPPPPPTKHTLYCPRAQELLRIKWWKREQERTRNCHPSTSPTATLALLQLVVARPLPWVIVPSSTPSFPRPKPTSDVQPFFFCKSLKLVSSLISKKRPLKWSHS